MRTSNPIESTFETVRHRTTKTKAASADKRRWPLSVNVPFTCRAMHDAPADALGQEEMAQTGWPESPAMTLPGVIAAHAVDAMDTGAGATLIRHTRAQIVINVGSSFVNMTVLEACIATGAAYLDTAIHEDPAKICETPPWYSNYEWRRRDRSARAGVIAILGVGFDPGVVNA